MNIDRNLPPRILGFIYNLYLLLGLALFIGCCTLTSRNSAAVVEAFANINKNEIRRRVPRQHCPRPPSIKLESSSSYHYHHPTRHPSQALHMISSSDDKNVVNGSNKVNDTAIGRNDRGAKSSSSSHDKKEDSFDSIIRQYNGGDEYIDLASLFYRSVHELGCQNYTKEQLDVWAPTTIDYEKWKTRFEQTQPYCCYLSVTNDDDTNSKQEQQVQVLVGFIEFDISKGHIDCHYVHPEYARRGIGTKLLQHVLDIAKEYDNEEGTRRRHEHIHVEASHLIRPLYEKYGFVCVQENIVERNGVKLTNWKMKLSLDIIPSNGFLQSSVNGKIQPSFSSSSPSSSSSVGFRLGYVTDVEGNYDYFKSYVAQSNVLKLLNENDDTTRGLQLDLQHENCYFVYGGDAVDKGIGDIRLCRALVSLKQKYPHRVYLLVGNRDLNKLRFTAELSDFDIFEKRIDDIPPPHWDPKAPTLRQYLESMLDRKEDSEGMNGGNRNNKSAMSTIEELNTRVNRLKYMLEHTLGCPDTFEFRRQELAILRAAGEAHATENSSNIEITDEEVLENFLYEVEHPTEGSLRQYLEHANVIAVVGNTMFVHGAVDSETAKFVPQFDTKFENPASKSPPHKICDSVSEWVQLMNEYLKSGLRDYEQRPLWDTYRTTRGGESLMALQNRPAMWGRSIVSNCYGDGGVITTDSAAEHRNDPQRLEQAKTNPLMFEKVSSDPMDPTVANWLLENGIHRVVVGHKPLGDSPAILSSRYTGVEIVSADTSYSDTSSPDNRGEALSIVEIVGSSEHDNRLQVSGKFRDGTTYQNAFPRLVSRHSKQPNNDTLGSSDQDGENGNIDDSCLLGTQLEDGSGWWVKAATSTHFRLCRGSGRKVEYKSVLKSELIQQLPQLLPLYN